MMPSLKLAKPQGCLTAMSSQLDWKILIGMVFRGE